MAFSNAQFQEVIDRIDDGMNKLSDKIAEIPSAVDSAVNHWYIPEPIKDAVRWFAEKITELGNWIYNKIKELLQDVPVPFKFFTNAFDWEDIRGIADGVGGQLKPTAMPATFSWTSPAGIAYSKIITPQGDAANRIGTIADKTATALNVCALVALAFYAAIAVVLVQFLIVMVAAIVAIASVVFSWAGGAGVLADASVSGAAIAAAIAALVAALATQKQYLNQLHGEAISDSFFPGGHWPNPMTSAYNHP
jgi:hypothetical protein